MVFIYHVHYFVEKYGGLKPFETENLEQLNYVNKLVFFGASNKGKENYTVTEQVTDIELKMQFLTNLLHFLQCIQRRCADGAIDIYNRKHFWLI